MVLILAISKVPIFPIGKFNFVSLLAQSCFSTHYYTLFYVGIFFTEKYLYHTGRMNLLKILHLKWSIQVCNVYYLVWFKCGCKTFSRLVWLEIDELVWIYLNAHIKLWNMLGYYTQQKFYTKTCYEYKFCKRSLLKWVSCF